MASHNGIFVNFFSDNHDPKYRISERSLKPIFWHLKFLLNVKTGELEDLFHNKNEVILIYITDGNENIDILSGFLETYNTLNEVTKKKIRTIILSVEEESEVMIKVKQLNIDAFPEVKVYTIKSGEDYYRINKFIID